MQSFRASPLVTRLARDGFVILATAFVLLRLFDVSPWNRGVDAFAYWSTRDGSFYDMSLAGTLGAYVYSPAFAQAISPLVQLPYPAFLAIWTTLLLAAYAWTVRLAALPLLLFIPIPFELETGNVHLLYAALIVVGFRFPAAWAFMALTKVTPFVGVVWFAVRREWRNLAIACGVTLALAAVSFALDPAAWRTWAEILTASSSTPTSSPGWFLPVPLLVRLPVALVVVAVAARLDRRWLLPVGIVLAMPVVWVNSLAVLAACVPLAGEHGTRVAVAGAPAGAGAPSAGAA